MSFVDELRFSRESAATAFQEFVKNLPNYSDDVHAFFEGHDDFSFYKGFISHHIQDNKQLKAYKCGNKEEVYKTYEKVIESGRGTATVIFFVDKDFSEFFGEVFPVSSKIYITDCYSIENYIVSAEMLFRVWEEIFSFTNVSFDFAKVEKQFRKELAQFYTWSLFLSAWIIYVRRNGEKPVLQNIKMSKVCKINDHMKFEGEENKKTQTYVEKVCSISALSGFGKELKTLLGEISRYEPKRYVRGKFELWFFVKFINQLYEVTRKQLSKGESLKMRTQISEENAIEILGPRTKIPESLKAFLKANIN